MPVRESAMLFGMLVHETIEDVHKAALKNEVNSINADSVELWLKTNYASLSKSYHSYLSETQINNALKHVMGYVKHQHGDWSKIKNAEVDVSLVKPEYIIEGKYNQIITDCIIPTIFHALFDITATQKTEEKEIILLRRPINSDFYEFSAREDLVVRKDSGFSLEQQEKSFHADTYCFDSQSEKRFFELYINRDDVKRIYFTGMFTSGQGDLSIYYYDPESGRLRRYYPDFFAEMKDNSYRLIEVKGDNMIDDAVVKAKTEAAREMAVASGIEYYMYSGSSIMSGNLM